MPQQDRRADLAAEARRGFPSIYPGASVIRPGTDQLGFASGDSIHCRSSEAGEVVYHKETKNVLCSYSPQKLGFF
jgi:hypothetical protein